MNAPELQMKSNLRGIIATPNSHVITLGKSPGRGGMSPRTICFKSWSLMSNCRVAKLMAAMQLSSKATSSNSLDPAKRGGNALDNAFFANLFQLKQTGPR